MASVKPKRNKRQTLVAASVAGLLALAAVPGMVQGHLEAAEEGKTKCYGVNKCKGTGDCGGKGHSCAGLNACQGQAWIYLQEKDCLRIQGGRLTPEEEG